MDGWQVRLLPRTMVSNVPDERRRAADEASVRESVAACVMGALALKADAVRVGGIDPKAGIIDVVIFPGAPATLCCGCPRNPLPSL